MAIKQTQTSVKINNKSITAVELTNENGTSVTILNYGAIIQKFLVKNKNGVLQDIVLGFDEVEGYVQEDYLQNYPYFGAIIGRYANRISGASFKIEDEMIQLPQNVGADTLHGGIEGFDKKIWDLEPIISDQQSFVTLSYLSPHGEEGFPGNLKVFITFTLHPDNALELYFQAETDVTTAVNLTHHSYFNLSPSIAPIHHHQHLMHAHKVLEQDENYCVTGQLNEVQNTLHDFRKMKSFSQDWQEGEGYDQTYVLDKPYKSFGLASLTSEEESGFTLEVFTDQPVLHLYTAKYLNVKNGKNHQNYTPFQAFCLETQHHPNAVNHPKFPNTVLKPGHIYEQKTVYKVRCTQN